MSVVDPDSDQSPLPLGKLPPQLLSRLLRRVPVEDPRVLVGPGVGLDCAVVDAGDRLLVLKSDPVTLAADQLGRYLVSVNVNDMATSGATPRWLLLTLLLPEGGASAALAEQILDQVHGACRDQGVALVGGHTEVTAGLQRPIAVGALVGEVARARLVTPRGARPGDRLLLTKSVPIEGTAILARERPARLQTVLTVEQLERARRFLFDPGISVLRDAEIALAAGRVSAMHDPTEGGLAAALWELAEASGCSLRFDPWRVPVSELAKAVCGAFGIDPLHTIASGALLLTAPAGDAPLIREKLAQAGIPCADIGGVGPGPAAVFQGELPGAPLLPWPRRDGLALALEDPGG